MSSNEPYILIAEDEPGQAEVLRYNLEDEGFRIKVATDGEKALQMVQEKMPDLMVLDWMLPETSGIEVLRHVRNSDELKHLPIIMLTARGDADDKLRGFEVGADDYMVKPFQPSELVARIQAVLRRARPELHDERLEFGDIVMDLGRQRVTRDDKNIELSSTEFRVLRALLSRPGRVFSRDRLIDLAWGTGTYLEDRTVDVSIRRLRTALNQFGGKDVIRTVRGEGYSVDFD